jgi:redox-sensitive bicupin YhaK (pirin superfamily)
MITLRRSAERGHADHGWLDTRHTFSFASYHDPQWMGYRNLRVVNEDRVAPGAGFGSHPHRDMEIISIVLEGGLAHGDSMGNGSEIRAGEVQVMGAGAGVVHSEHNASETEPVHFLQIWIQPRERGLEPHYAQRAFTPEELRDRLVPIAAGDGREGALAIRADATLYRSNLSAGSAVGHHPQGGRHVWVHVIRGVVEVNGTALAAGDGAALGGSAPTVLRSLEDADVLLFDLA